MNRFIHSDYPIKIFQAVLSISLLFSVLAKPIDFEVYAHNIQDTTQTAVRVADINAGTAHSMPSGLTSVGSNLFFSATDGIHGQELWYTRPPYSSAFMVEDINPRSNTDEPTNSSNPKRITAVGDNIFFTADDGKGGEELWMTQPPYDSARIVKDINAGKNGAFSKDLFIQDDKIVPELVSIGNALFFAADDGKNGQELWISEPPYDSNSTRMVSDIRWGSDSSAPHEFISLGWMLFFIADDGTNRSEIWKCEPPYRSAVRVTNIYPDGNARIEELTSIDYTLFFSAYTKEAGQELWKAVLPYGFENTSRVTDITGKTTSLDPKDIVPLGKILFFSGNVATQNPGYPECGSEAHKLLSVVDPDTLCSVVGTGNELWKSEPPYEATSTVRIADIFPGERSSNPSMKTVIYDNLIFSAYEQGSGQELYKIIPPYRGEDIYRIAEVNKLDGSTPTHYGGSYADDLTVVNATLYYTASDYGEYGRELYKAEPPYFKAERITDLMPDKRDAEISELTSIGRMLFFNAASPDYGIELFKLGGTYDYLLPNTGFAPGVSTHIDPQPTEKKYNDIGKMWLEIPSLNVRSAIVGVPASSEENWDLTWLNNEVGYLQDTAFPTWQGNTVITGHLYLQDGNPGPFIDLKSLKWGDYIFIHAWGERYIYQVRSTGVISPDDTSILEHKEEDWLTLLTCQDFDTDSEEYLSRLAVQAVLDTVVEDSGNYEY